DVTLVTYRIPRAQHSFPTRRSSDLRAHAMAAQIVGAPPVAGSDERDNRKLRQPPVQVFDDRRAVVLLHLEIDAGGVKAVALDQIDRKSTRLNSSHRTISYAVFCLKK